MVFGFQNAIAMCMLYLLVCVPLPVFSQDCSLPIISTFESPTAHEIKIRWIDFNPPGTTFEIEYGSIGFTRSFSPQVTDIDTNLYLLTDLIQGTTYELYLRARCGATASAWNGPYFFNTNIINGLGCNLELGIADNNCPGGNEFQIEVAGFDNLLLGEDIVVERLTMNIFHPWPPDLFIELISPGGEAVTLSAYNGQSIDHYGDPLDSLCSSPLVLRDEACALMEEAQLLRGEFKPEIPFSLLYNNSTVNGIWKIRICDRASGDIGYLQHIEILFSDQICILPEVFAIENIESQSIDLFWTPGESCTEIRLTIAPDLSIPSDVTIEYVDCSLGQFTLTGLDPSTEYELAYHSECGSMVSSAMSCSRVFKTACGESQLLQSFDGLAACLQNCHTPCVINGQWQNTGGDDSDWLINSGETPTPFTGPQGDQSKTGKYIYVESQPEICGQAFTTILESSCLQFNHLSENCHLSFYYHLYGADSGMLALEFTPDDGETWTELWTQSGDQGDQWHFEELEFDNDISLGRLRFVAKVEDGAYGDIALDHIKIMDGSQGSLITVYMDGDNDGFGSNTSFRTQCSQILPEGYVFTNGDCNDNDSLINPLAIEIPCNLVDENCNGLDSPSNNPLQFSDITITNTTCKGRSDGMIRVFIEGGTPPYSLVWSNGATSDTVTGLEEDIYYCSVTDADGCLLASPPLELSFESILLYSVIEQTPPFCQGQNDGRINLLVSGGTPPYAFHWSNGATGPVVSGLPDGTYKVTITDSENCLLISESFELKGAVRITSGPSQINHVECFGDSTGVIILGVTGGQPPYSFLWSSGDTASFIRDLPTGTYSVTVTDLDGCNGLVEDIEVTTPQKLEILIDGIDHATCHDGFDGKIQISVRGGQPPYAFFWSDGTRSDDLINRNAGTYNVTVTDFNACRAEVKDIRIEQPDEIVIEVDSILNVSCPGSITGFIKLNVAGGIPPYSYVWNDASLPDTNMLSGLGIGKYRVTVVDQFGCKSLGQNITIRDLNVPIQLALSPLDPIKCFGDSTASVMATVFNGKLPLDFNWSNGSKSINMNFTDSVSGLIAGSYNVTVTDNEGCIGISDSIHIDQPDKITYNVIEKKDNLCFGDSTGLIRVSPLGGTPPIYVNWGHGVTGYDLTGLPNGLYLGQLTDQNLCVELLSPIEISSPDLLIVMAVIIDSSPGQSNGRISIEVSGGSPPFAYEWGPPFESTSADEISGLSPGAYSLTVTDRHLCVIDTVLTVGVSTSTDDLPWSHVAISPNPADDLITIQADCPMIYFKLYSVSGHQVFDQVMAREHKYDIDVSRLNAGFYFAVIKCSNKPEQLLKIVIL